MYTYSASVPSEVDMNMIKCRTLLMFSNIFCFVLTLTMLTDSLAAVISSVGCCEDEPFKVSGGRVCVWACCQRIQRYSSDTTWRGHLVTESQCRIVDVLYIDHVVNRCCGCRQCWWLVLNACLL